MIWLLRHGDAVEDAEDDAARPLSESGVRQAVAAGKALESLNAGIAACLTSPRVRARDTARIICRQLGIEAEETQSLAGGHFDLVRVAGRAEDVLLVGHEPDLSHAIEVVTGARVKLRKGGLAAIADGTLVALLTPEQLGAIAAVREQSP
jgi:phosphohistidine phosphatase